MAQYHDNNFANNHQHNESRIFQSLYAYNRKTLYKLNAFYNLNVFFSLQDFLMKEEYSGLEYNLTTSELELVNVSASWDEVCLRPFVEPKRK